MTAPGKCKCGNTITGKHKSKCVPCVQKVITLFFSLGDK